MTLRLKAHYRNAWEIDTQDKLKINPTGISDRCLYTECKYHGKIILNIISNGMNSGTRCTEEKHKDACFQCSFNKLAEGEFYRALPGK